MHVICEGVKMMDTTYHLNGLVQYYTNSIANTLGLLQSCT